MAEEKKLTAKEKAWADAYLVTLSKAGAARIAKYKGDSNTLAHVGWENYRKEYIQAYMKDKLDQMAMPVNEVLARFAAMASSNLSDFASIKTTKDLEEREDGAVVKKFKRDIITDQLGRQHEKMEIELYDAQTALVHIGKAHGIFKETTTNLNLDLSQLTNEQLQRIAAGEDPAHVISTTQSIG